MSVVSVPVPESTWTKVADAKKGGLLSQPLNMGEFAFYYTTRDAGSAAPVNIAGTNPNNLDSGLAKKLFDRDKDEEIVSDIAIDVYVWAVNSDGDNSDTARILVEL